MSIILFIIILSLLMIKKFLDWNKLNKQISDSMKWKTIEGTLVDFQCLENEVSGIKKIRNSQSYYAFAKFEIKNKIFGCQRISFYPNNHIVNSDYLNEIPESKKVKIWYNPKNPSQSVLLSPDLHEKEILLVKMLAFEILAGSMIVIGVLIA